MMQRKRVHLRDVRKVDFQQPEAGIAQSGMQGIRPTGHNLRETGKLVPACL